MKNPTEFVSLADLSEEIGASRGTIRRWLDAAGVPAYQLGGPGGVVRYRRDDVDDWLDEAGGVEEEAEDLDGYDADDDADDEDDEEFDDAGLDADDEGEGEDGTDDLEAEEGTEEAEADAVSA